MAEAGEVEKVEDFYGVYLLVSQNPKYKGRTFWFHRRSGEKAQAT